MDSPPLIPLPPLGYVLTDSCCTRYGTSYTRIYTIIIIFIFPAIFRVFTAIVFHSCALFCQFLIPIFFGFALLCLATKGVLSASSRFIPVLRLLLRAKSVSLSHTPKPLDSLSFYKRRYLWHSRRHPLDLALFSPPSQFIVI